jgi:hypothetical protein
MLPYRNSIRGCGTRKYGSLIEARAKSQIVIIRCTPRRRDRWKIGEAYLSDQTRSSFGTVTPTQYVSGSKGAPRDIMKIYDRWRIVYSRYVSNGSCSRGIERCLENSGDHDSSTKAAKILQVHSEAKRLCSCLNTLCTAEVEYYANHQQASQLDIACFGPCSFPGIYLRKRDKASRSATLPPAPACPFVLAITRNASTDDRYTRSLTQGNMPGVNHFHGTRTPCQP